MYKSKLLHEKDLQINTHRKWLDEEQTDYIFVVEILHKSSGICVVNENKSQLKAYNSALRDVEFIYEERLKLIQ